MCVWGGGGGGGRGGGGGVVRRGHYSLKINDFVTSVKILVTALCLGPGTIKAAKKG